MYDSPLLLSLLIAKVAVVRIVCSSKNVPVNDADHAVLTIVGAVDAQFVQQVQQQHAEVAVKLADGSFQAGIWLDGVHVLS